MRGRVAAVSRSRVAAQVALLAEKWADEPQLRVSNNRRWLAGGKGGKQQSWSYPCEPVEAYPLVIQEKEAGGLWRGWQGEGPIACIMYLALELLEAVQDQT